MDDIGYYHAEITAKAGEEYDSDYPYPSYFSDSNTGDNFLNVGRGYH